MEEFEIKFLEIDVPLLEKKLLSIGAKKAGEYEYKRVLLDYPDWRLDKKHAWVRLRTDGTLTTLSYKERIGIKSRNADIPDDGMKEIEVEVEDYNKTFELFREMGFVIKREQGNRRVRYTKGTAVFDIDFWPQIPPYLEIEGNSLEEAYASAQELGFDPKKGLVCSAKQVYRKYGFEEDDYSSMTFAGFIKR